MVVHGKQGELLALRHVTQRTLVVVYRELSRLDGFVITAFFTTTPDRIERRGVLWPKRLQ